MEVSESHASNSGGRQLLSKKAMFPWVTVSLFGALMTLYSAEWEAISLAHHHGDQGPLTVSSVSSLMAVNASRVEGPPSLHADWCSGVVCENSPVCQPCQRRFLFVIATGRSASTTLNFMLDSLPGLRMSGENNNFLHRMRDMINLVHNPKAAGKKTAFGHNPVPPGAFSCATQQVLQTINPPLIDRDGRLIEPDATNSIVGFKTIRFMESLTDDEKDEDLDAFVDWVKQTFPCLRVIVNIRSDVEAQTISMTKSFSEVRAQLLSFSDNNITNEVALKLNKHLEVADTVDKMTPAQQEFMKGFAAKLRETNRQMQRIKDMFGEQGFLVDASEWTKDVTHLNRAVEWLGFDKSCFFTKLLDMNTNSGYTSGEESELTLDPRCRYIGGANKKQAGMMLE